MAAPRHHVVELHGQSRDRGVMMNDVEIIDVGTMIGFRPLTRPVKAWLRDNVHVESWHWMGGTLWVDPGRTGPIVKGIIEADFDIEKRSR
jgi:hypothetical protein